MIIGQHRPVTPQHSGSRSRRMKSARLSLSVQGHCESPVSKSCNERGKHTHTHDEEKLYLGQMKPLLYNVKVFWPTYGTSVKEEMSNEGLILFISENKRDISKEI